MKLTDMKIPLLVMVLLSLFIPRVNAIYFDSIIYDMNDKQDFISRAMVNDTKRSNLYTISAYKISRPGNGNEQVISNADRELIWSPLRFTVQPDGKEFFKIYYVGPKDNIERYYRVTFTETPITLFNFRNEQKIMDAIPVVSMSTILIVRPRKINMKYEVDEANAVIKNTGNTFFRVILQSGCNGTDEGSTQFYMLPGEKWKGSMASASNKKFIVALDRYYKLGMGCHISS